MVPQLYIVIVSLLGFVVMLLLDLRGGALFGVIFSISTIVLVLDEKGLYWILGVEADTVVSRDTRMRVGRRAC